MTMLRETQEALAQVSSNIMQKSGMHPSGNIRVGTQGLYIGTETYDPIRHSAFDIDTLSPFTFVYEEDQVTQVMPERPLTASLVIDSTLRSEHPVITEAKTILGESLSEAIAAARPGLNDRLYTYVAVDGQDRTTDLPLEYEKIEVADAQDLQGIVARFALRGLAFVISDFSKWDFDKNSSALPLHDVVAVKVNHPAERFLPPGLGVVPIGEGKGVNTDNPRKRNKANAELEARHTGIVSGLEAAGARVASVIAVLNGPWKFDVQATDHALATAIEATQRV